MPDNTTQPHEFTARDLLAARFAAAIIAATLHDSTRWPKQPDVADQAYKYADAFLDRRSKD